VPVSDASAKRAAAWLAAWARAGLLGTDPEVAAYVADLLNFVGERTMEKADDGLVVECLKFIQNVDERLRSVADNPTPCEATLADGFTHLFARARELEAENARLRGGLRPFAEWAKGWHANWPDHLPVNETKTDDSPTLGDCRRAAEHLGDPQ